MKKGITVIEDCYNASPDSMHAGLRVLYDYDTEGARVALLGTMLELGEYAKHAHIECGYEAGTASDMLVLYGAHAEDYKTGALRAGMDENRIYVFEDKREAAKTLCQSLRSGDVLFVKGSRSTRMEQIIALIFEGDF